jgi:hemerythrin-like domain-containing protein
MSVTDILTTEHRRITKIAEACERFSLELRQGGKIPTRILESVTEFLGVYTNQYHQEEERWLLNILKQKGVPPASWPIEILDQEDYRLSRLVDLLIATVDDYVMSDSSATAGLEGTLHAVSEMYLDHIWKEENVLFPMANALLTDADQDLLRTTFRIIEFTRGGFARRTSEQLNDTMEICPVCAPHEEQTATVNGDPNPEHCPTVTNTSQGSVQYRSFRN